MSILALDFLEGQAPDSRGRTLKTYLAFNHDEWDSCHDFIQWAFPTQTPSAYNPDAPLLPADVPYTPVHQQNVLLLMVAFLDSLGVTTVTPTDGSAIIKFRYTPSQLGYNRWPRYNSHNNKRLTRVIECLTLFGLEAFRDELAEFLLYTVAMQYPNSFDVKTVVYWLATWQNKRELLPS